VTVDGVVSLVSLLTQNYFDLLWTFVYTVAEAETEAETETEAVLTR
jgi:hypothetical protein